jgi:endoglucanase
VRGRGARPGPRGVTDMGVATPLSASGRFIVDANGRRVKLAGVNWYGAHEDLGIPAGLEFVHRTTLAATIAGLGFNSVRLPFSLWMTARAAPAPARYLAANPDLDGATPMQVYDACVRALTAAGLIVIPNCHMLDPGWCCSESDANGLWFNDTWPAARFFAAWQAIADRYKAEPLVAGMDIMNEPRRATVGGRVLTPTWGGGGRTDLAAMYAAAGNLLHEINPDLLIICEGPEFAATLAGVAGHPVRLDRPGKVVYSLHDYAWFHPGRQSQAAYARQMDAAAAGILARDAAPLWIGEFGTDTRPAAGSGSSPWWRNLRAWLAGTDADWCWWALNPTQPRGTVPVTGQHRSGWGDPEWYGLLSRDWRRPGNPAVLDILRSLIPPRVGPGVGAGPGSRPAAGLPGRLAARLRRRLPGS